MSQLLLMGRTPTSYLDTRLEISEVDEQGNVVGTTFGPTMREQWATHRKGTCDFLCSYCYNDACNYLYAQNPKIRDQETT